MKPDTIYTVGQIHRLGLMISRKGTPYRDKAAIIRIIKRHKLTHTRILTPRGYAYRIRLSTIRAHNARVRDRIKA